MTGEARAQWTHAISKEVEWDWVEYPGILAVDDATAGQTGDAYLPPEWCERRPLNGDATNSGPGDMGNKKWGWFVRRGQKRVSLTFRRVLPEARPPAADSGAGAEHYADVLVDR